MPDLLEQLTAALKAKGFKIATAESCTGGMIAAVLTCLPGSSAIFDRGWVTYSNESKNQLLNVPEDILREHGAVSPQTAEAMVAGVLKFSEADIAVSVTGIAGPDGGTIEKPVGLVFIGYGLKSGEIKTAEHHFNGNRDEVREQTVAAALTHALELLS